MKRVHLLNSKELMVALSMGVIYCFCIFGRSYFSVVSDSIRQEIPGLDTASLSKLYVVAGLFFGAGKMITVIAIDAYDTRHCLYAFILLSCVCVFCFSYVNSLTAMMIWAALNAIPQAGTYPALGKLVYEWFSAHQYGRVFTFISVGSRMGSAVTALVLGISLNYMNWRQSIQLAPVLMVFGIVITYFTLDKKLTRKGRNSKAFSNGSELFDAEAQEKKKNLGDTVSQQFYRIASSTQFWLISFSSGCLLVSKGFEVFVPVYMKDLMNVDSSTAGICSSSVPLGIVVSLIMFGWKLESSSEKVRSVAVQFLCLLNFISALSLFFISYIIELYGCFNKQFCVWLNVLFFFLLGFSAGYPFYIPQSVFAIEFGGESSAKVVGFAELIQAVISSGFVLLAGEVGEHYGWRYVWCLVSCTSFIGLMCMVGFYHPKLQTKMKKWE